MQLVSSGQEKNKTYIKQSSIFFFFFLTIDNKLGCYSQSSIYTAYQPKCFFLHFISKMFKTTQDGTGCNICGLVSRSSYIFVKAKI